MSIQCIALIKRLIIYPIQYYLLKDRVKLTSLIKLLIRGRPGNQSQRHCSALHTAQLGKRWYKYWDLVLIILYSCACLLKLHALPLQA